MSRFTASFVPVSNRYAVVKQVCRWCELTVAACECIECTTCHVDVTFNPIVITDLPCGHPVWGKLVKLPYLALCSGCETNVLVQKRGPVFCSIECASVFK